MPSDVADPLLRGGMDTELARLLHERKQLDQEQLVRVLNHVRRNRAQGETLAHSLVAHRLLDEGVVLDALDALAARKSAGTEAGAPSAPTRSRDPWQPGQSVGGYVILEPLGAGGMGKVFLVEERSSGKRFALKTVDQGADPELISRLRREGLAQQRLEPHPNLVRSVGQGVEGGRLYLVMELVEGTDLHERLRAERFERDDAVLLARDLALGLAHMHASGVLHRDIKPANVLLAADGTPKLVDFGLARFEGARTLTRTGDLLGTPAYMAPEQALGERSEVDFKADVYSLAAVLYELLTARPPFQASGTVEILTKLVTEDPEPPSAHDPRVPPWLDAIVLRALSKEPEERPTAEELAGELSDFICGAKTGKRKAKAYSRRRRGRLPKLLGALLIFGAGLGAGELLRGSGKEAPGGTASAPPSAAVPVDSIDDAAPPAAEEAPLLAGWIPGEERRYRLTTTSDGTLSQFGPDRFRFEVLTQLEMTFRAKSVAEWVTVEASVDRFAITWTGELEGQERRTFEPMEFDSELSRAEHPFARVRGSRFGFDAEPSTGKVLVVRGAAAIQEQIFEAVSDTKERWRYRVPLFSSDASLRAALNGVLHLVGERGEGGSWHVARTPLEQTGREPGPQDPTGEPIFASFVCDASQGCAISWTGKGRQDQPLVRRNLRGGGLLTYRTITTRELGGSATLEEGQVSRSEAKESWRTVRKGDRYDSSGSATPVEAISYGRTTLLLERR